MTQTNRYLLSGLAIFALGCLAGAGLAFWSASSRGPATEALPEVEGSVFDENSVAVTPQEAPQDESSPTVANPVKATETPVPNAPAPQVKAAVKVNPCVGAKTALVSAVAAAEKARDEALAAAKKTFDAGQLEAGARLSDLARDRNDSVNSYLTAIAIATSKYNSSKETNAYDIYQQEQAAALAAYTKKIGEIAAAEMPLLKQKKDAQSAYDSAVSSIQIKFTTDQKTAQDAYAAKGCG